MANIEEKPQLIQIPKCPKPMFPIFHQKAPYRQNVLGMYLVGTL